MSTFLEQYHDVNPQVEGAQAEMCIRDRDMSIEHTLTNDWDLKLLTREEMLKDTTNRLYSVYKRMGCGWFHLLHMPLLPQFAFSPGHLL